MPSAAVPKQKQSADVHASGDDKQKQTKSQKVHTCTANYMYLEVQPSSSFDIIEGYIFSFQKSLYIVVLH